MSITTDGTGLPGYPGVRSRPCPFDPPTEYTDWRESEGLRRVRLGNGNTAWVVSRYEDVTSVLTDPRISADSKRFDYLIPHAKNQPPAFPRMDVPEHGRRRRMLTRDFTVKRVEAMRPQIQEIVDDFLDRMIDKGQPADLVQEFALPVPSLVISLLLGVPYEDHESFQQHARTLNLTQSSIEEKQRAQGALTGYLRELLDRKEREPGDDLLSRMMIEDVGTGNLTRDEAALNGHTILFAGHETTANMIALSAAALLDNPGQAARIRDTDDPKVVAKAVEELLRYLSIAQDMISRVATEDLTIGGQRVRAGDILTINLPAANRDKSFLKDADLLDVDRDTRRHLAFGHGVHPCLGQHLARTELQVALPTLLRRLPDLALAVPLEEVSFRHEMAAYGVHELPVTW
ncbi:cytochrome P450 [Streptomyces sp. NPDC096311]|uniref:cytochrome P450 n=1 Tax=Streptomyces sp. NPDC096311 TaxID=3366083 RepID=UPI003815AD91